MQPVIDYARDCGKLIEVDASGMAEEVQQAVWTLLFEEVPITYSHGHSNGRAHAFLQTTARIHH